jgi:hypothetical protein
MISECDSFSFKTSHHWTKFHTELNSMELSSWEVCSLSAWWKVPYLLRNQRVHSHALKSLFGRNLEPGDSYYNSLLSVLESSHLLLTFPLQLFKLKCYMHLSPPQYVLYVLTEWLPLGGQVGPTFKTCPRHWLPSPMFVLVLFGSSMRMLGWCLVIGLCLRSFSSFLFNYSLILLSFDTM